MYNLRSDTGHEAGIIIYNSGEVAVYNWIGINDNAIPLLSPFGTPINWTNDVGEDDKLAHICSTDDIREYLPGTIKIDGGELKSDMVVAYDANEDIPALFGFGPAASVYNGVDRPYSGHIWQLSSGERVITLDLWN